METKGLDSELGSNKSVRGIAEAMDSDSIMEGGPVPPETSKPTTSATDAEAIDLATEGMQSIGLKSKKLSGAQRKKALKAKKMAAGTWTAEKPCSETKKAVQGGPAEGVKRPRSESQTPPTRMTGVKKPRSEKSQTGSYSDTVKGIRLAVIQRRHPDDTLSQGQADLVQNALVEALYAAPSGSTSPPQFMKTTFASGVLWMTCANKETATWLRQAVNSLGRLWEGADLSVVDSGDLPARPRVLVFVPEPDKVTVAEVKSRLKVQNPALRTEDWTTMSRKIEKEGQLLAFSIDEASFKALERTQLKAYYKLGRVTFRVIGKQDANKGGTSEPPAL